ncbi:2OG-Fe(II) oxygenase [Phyllobacterium sp. 628]|uniref:2OG-Fe(II) oxygenase n=1 Tax=Phyllobacterium sp. 628 TaxID=2718938 RepID=UPI0016626F42|nr:2OG-Fe(II) oxygenase [Phyllobacterium sp. 628]QND52716.1 2OG-Fe(II) oxygenase [Phyllobacterium sp. 628]
MMTESSDKTATPWQGITVIENLLNPTEQQALYTFLVGGGWGYGWRSHSGEGAQTFWHKHFAGALGDADQGDIDRQKQSDDCAAELAARAPLIHAFWQKLSQTALKGHLLQRCYANGLPYGNDGATHTDSLQPGACTAVYYPHESWDPDWGGETILFNQDKSDILAAIYAKPNRLLIFPGFVHHVARGVSRVCPHMRITLMFKTRVKLE